MKKEEFFEELKRYRKMDYGTVIHINKEKVFFAIFVAVIISGIFTLTTFNTQVKRNNAYVKDTSEKISNTISHLLQEQNIKSQKSFNTLFDESINNQNQSIKYKEMENFISFIKDTNPYIANISLTLNNDIINFNSNSNSSSDSLDNFKHSYNNLITYKKGSYLEINKDIFGSQGAYITTAHFDINVDYFNNILYYEAFLVFTYSFISFILIAVVFNISDYYSTIHPLKKINSKLKSMSNKDYTADNFIFYEGNEINLDEITTLRSHLSSLEKKIKGYTISLQAANWENEHDPMTKIYNRRKLGNMVDFYQEQKSIGVINFDINFLKLVNDKLGHTMGDKLIYMFSDALRITMNQNEIDCYRIGGDEFLIIQNNKSEDDLYEVVANLNKNLEEINKNNSLFCSVSYGTAFSEVPFDMDDLFNISDQRMYEHKEIMKYIDFDNMNIP